HKRVRRHLQVVRVPAMGVVAIDLDRHLLAELLPAGAAMVALGAALIMVHHHALADAPFLLAHGRADRNHDAAGLMARNDRSVPHRYPAGLLPSLGPAVLMQIAAA